MSIESINKSLSGRVQAIPKGDASLTQEGYYADAKAVGEKFTATNEIIKGIRESGEKFSADTNKKLDELSKCDYHEDITIKGTLYGKGYYLETHNMVIIHIGVSTTSDIKTGEVFAELNALSKNIQKIDNLGVLDMDGNGYGFKVENKSIISQSEIPQGAKLLFDVCLKVS